MRSRLACIERIRNAVVSNFFISEPAKRNFLNNLLDLRDDIITNNDSELPHALQALTDAYIDLATDQLKTCLRVTLKWLAEAQSACQYSLCTHRKKTLQIKLLKIDVFTLQLQNLCETLVQSSQTPSADLLKAKQALDELKSNVTKSQAEVEKTKTKGIYHFFRHHRTNQPHGDSDQIRNTWPRRSRIF